MDTELPVVGPVEPPVHVFSADLHGIAAVGTTGEDGEEYCVIDSEVLIGNPEAREYAHATYVKARSRALRRRSSFAA